MRQSKSRKGSKEAWCFKCNKVRHFKQNYLLWKKCKGEKKGDDFLSLIIDLEGEDFLLVVLEEPGMSEESETASVVMEE